MQIEVRYHRSCYTLFTHPAKLQRITVQATYTAAATDHSGEEGDCSSCSVDPAFKQFPRSEVEEDEMHGKDVAR